MLSGDGQEESFRLKDVAGVEAELPRNGPRPLSCISHKRERKGDSTRKLQSHA